MKKTILITGATDGIGLETAKRLVTQGHDLLIHGRSDAKLAVTKKALADLGGTGSIIIYRADLAKMQHVNEMAASIARNFQDLDVVINNAGVFKASEVTTNDGYDIRFIVNTIAPWLLTKRLLPIMSPDSRVINLSSAAQSPVDLDALYGKAQLSDNAAYAQSKLAITMWSFHLAKSIGDKGPAIIAVNPASLLASKMVKEAYGVAGNDLGVGADILVRSAVSDEFQHASGKYYDNDRHQFSQPHPDALDPVKNDTLVKVIESILARIC